MTIKAGERMPAGKFKVMGKDGPQDLTTAQLFEGKRVVLFSVPGAFTPTCDAKHLPGFVQRPTQIHAKGVDTIACMAVNDVFVMNAWGKASGVGDKIADAGRRQRRVRQGTRAGARRRRLRHGHARPALRAWWSKTASPAAGRGRGAADSSRCPRPTTSSPGSSRAAAPAPARSGTGRRPGRYRRPRRSAPRRPC